MLWEDENTVILEAGRRANVPCGAIGLNFNGNTIYAGERPLLVGEGKTGESKNLPTAAEQMEIARYMIRAWQSFEKTVRDDDLPPPLFS